MFSLLRQHRFLSTIADACLPILCLAMLIAVAAPLPCRAQSPASQATAETLRFDAGTLDGWNAEGEGVWSIQPNPEDAALYRVTSLGKGEEGTGVLRSLPFTIEKPIQRFSLAGADGTAEKKNNGDRNFLLLRSHPDGEILRRMRPPGTHVWHPKKWETWDLVGRRVFIEVVDGNPRLHVKGFAWMGLADYRQEDSAALKNPVDLDDLSGLKIDDAAVPVVCRTLPFLAAVPEERGETKRVVQGLQETIPVGAEAETLFILGMINHGWDFGQSHWGEHPELRKTREDQVHIGSRIGEIEIRYADASSDRIPVVMGATAWFVAQWAYGPTHGVVRNVREPFASRPEYAAVFDRCMKIKESEEPGSKQTTHMRYFLAVTPRPKKVESIIVHDNPAMRGKPLVTALTLAGAKPAEHLEPFGKWRADASDLKPAFQSKAPGDWSKDLEALADVLYTKESDLPKKVDLIDFPEEMNAATIRFHGDVMADMLSNIWVANLTQIEEKFERDTGFFHESGKDYPWYGGYQGVGTWAPMGIYYSGAFGRCSDHFVTLALRCIDDPVRINSFVNFVDKYIYFYRSNHDPDKGPPNAIVDVDRYPKDAPGHWSFVIHGGGPPWQVNEIVGDEETDGHGATIVARWVAWRMLGAPTGDWLTAPREEIFGKSRWDVTCEAAEFVCWLLDYTGMDVLYCEGETTGWGGKAPWGMRLTGVDDWFNETDPEKIRRNYANANMYEVYPSHVCMIGLRCSAQIADAIGKTEDAKRWRAYADRLQSGMVRLLAPGEHGNMMWKESRFSVYPSLQDSLVQAWFSIYYDGLDPQRWNTEMTGITRNTLRRQLGHPYGHAAVLGMGYGQGWLTKAALVLDEFDDAGPLLINIAKYTYDKNMNYVDEDRGIDWRKYQWMIPEGTNILPDGSWYRIGDLTNGANQGPAMHALELCAGIDDTKPAELKIMPRVPDPLTGLEIENFAVLIPDGKGLARAKVAYTYDRKTGVFKLQSDRPLPNLAVRLGPFDNATANGLAHSAKRPQGSTVRVEMSGTYNDQPAWWVWVEGMANITQLELGGQEDVPYERLANIVYHVDHGVGFILDVYKPKTGGNGLGIVHTMNGGYHSTDELIEHFRKDFRIFDTFCSRGYTVFSVRTGSRTRFTCDDMIGALQTGIRWVKAHAAEYSIDPERLGLTGASAGGQLALLAVLRDAEDGEVDGPLKQLDTSVRAMAVMFPVTDFPERLGEIMFLGEMHGRSKEEISEKAKALSPIRHVRASMPPLLIVHGDQDRSVPFEDSKRMVAAVRDVGGHAELIVKAGGNHNWPTMYEEVAKMADWFDGQLREKKQDKGSTTDAAGQGISADALRFADGTLGGWTVVEGGETWEVTDAPPIASGNPEHLRNVNSLTRSGEEATGVLRSALFVIDKSVQRFLIAGADGTASGTNNGDRNYLLLRSHPDEEVLRKEHTPGGHVFTAVRWVTTDLIGREVYLELVDRNPGLHAGAYGWISLADYRQEDWRPGEQPVERDDLFGLEIDENAKRVHCRTLPFLAAPPKDRGKTKRVVDGTTETIPINAAADALYILGLTNGEWDNGLAFWTEHPELWEERPDQLHIGVRIGEVEIRYADGASDRVPLVIGQTAWFARWYSGGSEPFASRDDYRAEFEKRVKFCEDLGKGPHHERYYLGIKTRSTEIASLVIHDNPKKQGRPMVSAVTLAGTRPSDNLVPFGKLTAATGDLKPRIDAQQPGDWSQDVEALSDLLYTSEQQLPKKVELLGFPKDLAAAKIRFLGGAWGDMLSNIWVANMTQIDRDKFEGESGFFRESEKGGPSYGGYMGVGVWGRAGSYHQWAFSRTSDHYATLALRLIDNDQRLTSYVDFVDKWLYFHRANRDLDKGPPNEKLDVTKYPKDAPPHWSFIVNGPLDAVPTSVNEISGNEEMDGHGSTVVGRWAAWRMLGMPTGDWLTKPRESVYGKSRWDSTRDAADFIVWLMDYTGRDVMYCEGESTGWHWGGRIPFGMENETDRAKLRQHYANMNMFEPYPTYVCLTGLRCAAEMAEAVGEGDVAKKYRLYADRLQTGMLRQLVEGMKHELTWQLSPYSVYPLPHHCLAQAWFSMYRDGLDPMRLDPEMTQISRNTLRKLLKMKCGHHPVFGFGYGLGWLTQSALILDELDDAGKCLVNIAKYSYDKNMDFVDEERGIDWRRWLWLIPEGTNIMPTGRWHRIGDLSNGANQGITLHALETCAGIDDTKPAELKIMPRVPDPLTGLEITDFPVLIPDGKGLARAKVAYTCDRKTGVFKLRSDRALPNLAVRLGPFDGPTAERFAAGATRPTESTVRMETSGTHGGQPAWWVWIEGLHAVSELTVAGGHMPTAANADAREEKAAYVAIPLAAHGIWGIVGQTPHGAAAPPFLTSRNMGEDKTGTILSPDFKLSEPRVRLCLRGWDSQAGGAGKNRVELVDAVSNEVLRAIAPPQTDAATWVEWDTAALSGKRVRVRVIDGDTAGGFAWLGLEAIDAGADFQVNFAGGISVLNGWKVQDADGKDIVGETVNIDGLPFKAAAGSAVPQNGTRQIELGFRAKRLFVLGLSNTIDWGCPVWAPVIDYHHRYFIGDRLGEIRVNYAGGRVDVYPLILGDSMWWGNLFAQHPEPFASDPATVKVLAANLKVYPPRPTAGGRYVACIDTADLMIDSLEFVDHAQKAGAPVIAGLTAEVTDGTPPRGTTPLDHVEMKPELASFVDSMALSPESAPPEKRQARLDALRDLLYTSHKNFPESVALTFPDGYRGPTVRFEGNAYAQVLTNVFHYNLKDMDDRVDERGMYHTSAKDAASWGGYFGFGTWNQNWASYYQHSWARDMGRALMELVALGIVDKAKLNADYAILMGRVWDEGRMPEMPLVETHGLKIGPFDIDGHDIPYHWSRILNIPSTRDNTGCFDNDSHGLTMMSVYNLCRRLPNRRAWLEPRWQYLVKAGDWIKWQFDNPKISGATDLLIRTDSESSHGTGFSIYPDYTCMEGLRGFAEMADSLGETAKAAEWRETADRLRRGMARDYPVDDDRYGKVWTLKHAGWPHQSTVLAPVILAPDCAGFAPEDCDQEFLPITERSYQRLIDAALLHTPRGAYGGAMGYSQGFVTQAALLLDRMDEASEMLRWTARFVYYNAPIEAERYLVPEGAEVIPSGEYWHRIGDLGNGVQQAETIKTLRLVMGVDNTGGKYALRLVPRLPYDWSAIHVEDHPVWIEQEGGARQVALSYNLTRAGRGMRLDVRCDHPLPAMEVRLGALKEPTPAFGVLLNGAPVESLTKRSGDAVWVRLDVPAGQEQFTIEIR